MNCKLIGKTAVLLIMVALCLLFVPTASAAGTTGGVSVDITYYNDSFKLPADMTNIEKEALYGCEKMTGVVIPEGVKSIGDAAFHGCNYLTDVYYHGTREQWNELTIGTDNLPLQRAEIHFVVDTGNLANLTWVLDDTGKLTISGTGEMPDLDHPKNVFYQGQWFPYLDRILTVHIGSGVKSIGQNAFCYCSNLVSVTIPSSVTSIGEAAFDDCRALTSVTIPDSVTSIGAGAFYYCESLKSVTIPSGVTSIGGSTFGHCYELESVTIPSSVKSISDSAFYYCESLKSVTIPSGVTSIEDRTFSNCVELESVTIPSSVKSIGKEAFNICESLKSIMIPSSVTSIGEDAFYGCIALTSVTIPDSVTSIGDYAFCWCSSLKSVTISARVTSIGVGTFSRCSALESVTIPSSVKSIGKEAFNNCKSLKSIMIPSSVTSIGDRAFNSCPLQFVYYGGTQEQWQDIVIGAGNDALLNATIHTVDQKFEIISFTRNPLDGRVTGTTSFNPTLPNEFTLTVTASEDNLTYTWKWRENGASVWQNIESAPMFRVNDAHSNWIQFLTEDSSLNGHSYEFKCTVSKGYLNVDTSIVNIYVVNPDGTTPAAPVITEHPKSITASGGTAVFKVTATGSSLSYQWQYRESASGSWKNATDTGSKTTQLTVNVTNSKNGYQYRCVVSNAGGAVNSNPATLTVRPEGTAPVVTDITCDVDSRKVTGSQTYAPGTPNQFSLTVTATGDNLTYSWKWREKGGNKTWNDLSTIETLPMTCYNFYSNPVTIYLYDQKVNGHTYEFKCVVKSGNLSTDSSIIDIEVVGPSSSTS